MPVARRCGRHESHDPHPLTVLALLAGLAAAPSAASAAVSCAYEENRYRLTITSAAEEGDLVKGMENATGGSGADRFLGTGVAANLFLGGGGDDWLDGGPGSDILHGGLGTDTLSYADRTATVAIRLDGLRNDGDPARRPAQRRRRSERRRVLGGGRGE